MKETVYNLTLTSRELGVITRELQYREVELRGLELKYKHNPYLLKQYCKDRGQCLRVLRTIKDQTYHELS